MHLNWGMSPAHANNSTPNTSLTTAEQKIIHKRHSLVVKKKTLIRGREQEVFLQPLTYLFGLIHSLLRVCLHLVVGVVCHFGHRLFKDGSGLSDG